MQIAIAGHISHRLDQFLDQFVFVSDPLNIIFLRLSQLLIIDRRLIQLRLVSAGGSELSL